MFGLLLGGFILDASAAGIDPFYLSRIAAGKEAYRSARFQEAVEDLRIGCFGLLEQPPLLLECSARLAVAQAAAGRSAEVDVTLRKMNDLEGRFGAWRQVDLEAPVRADFARLLKDKKGLDTLATAVAAPALASAPAPAPAPTSIPPSAQPSTSPSPAPPVPAPGRGVSEAPRPEAAPVASENSVSADDVRRLLQERNFDRAVAASTALLEREPGSREVRKLVLESAVLTRKFDLAASQIPALEPFREGEDGAAFYAAVSLFETGSVDKARLLAAKAIPRVVASAYVEYYRKKILD